MGINHRCEECGKQFTSRARLNKHQLIHEGKQYPFAANNVTIKQLGRIILLSIRYQSIRM
jgi:hypothetical protein